MKNCYWQLIKLYTFTEKWSEITCQNTTISFSLRIKIKNISCLNNHTEFGKYKQNAENQLCVFTNWLKIALIIPFQNKKEGKRKEIKEIY